MESLVILIHVVVCFLIILAVLLQGSNQDGMGSAFGGANSSSTFGAAGSTSLLGKVTYVTATLFMVTSIWLTILQGANYDLGIDDGLGQEAPISASAAEDGDAGDDAAQVSSDAAEAENTVTPITAP